MTQKSSVTFPHCRSVVKSSVYTSLRRALAIYRMVFGQSRQEDLITYLLAHIPEDERSRTVAELKMDLIPMKLNIGSLQSTTLNYTALTHSRFAGGTWGRRTM